MPSQASAWSHESSHQVEVLGSLTQEEALHAIFLRLVLHVVKSGVAAPMHKERWVWSNNSMLEGPYILKTEIKYLRWHSKGRLVFLSHSPSLGMLLYAVQDMTPDVEVKGVLRRLKDKTETSVSQQEL